jgi:hypothetical protein
MPMSVKYLSPRTRSSRSARRSWRQSRTTHTTSCRNGKQAAPPLRGAPEVVRFGRLLPSILPRRPMGTAYSSGNRTLGSARTRQSPLLSGAKGLCAPNPISSTTCHRAKISGAADPVRRYTCPRANTCVRHKRRGARPLTYHSTSHQRDLRPWQARRVQVDQR